MTNVTIANSFMKITIYDRYSRMSVAERDAAFAEFPTLKKDYHDAIELLGVSTECRVFYSNMLEARGEIPEWFNPEFRTLEIVRERK